MAANFKDQLKRKYTFLIENIVDVNAIINYLYQEDVLTEQLKDSLSCEVDPSKRISKVLDHVIRCALTSQKAFYDALIHSGNLHVHEALSADSGTASGLVSGEASPRLPRSRTLSQSGASMSGTGLGSSTGNVFVVEDPADDALFVNKLTEFSQSPGKSKKELLKEMEDQHSIQLRGLQLQSEIKKLENKLEHELRMEQIDHERDERIEKLETQLQLKRMMVEHEADAKFLSKTVNQGLTTAADEEQQRSSHFQNLDGDHEFKVAISCIWLAQHPGSQKAQVVEKLKDCLSSSDRLVRQCAVVALQYMKAMEAIPNLINMWRNDKIKDVRQTVEDALHQFGDPQVDREIKATLELLDELKRFRGTVPESPQKDSATHPLASKPTTTSSKATTAQCRGLMDPSANVRVHSLMEVVLAEDLAFTKKLRLTTGRLEDPDRIVRQAACIILGGFKDPSSEDCLMEVWRNDEISIVRDEAKEALERIGGSDMSNSLGLVTKLHARIEAFLCPIVVVTSGEVTDSKDDGEGAKSVITSEASVSHATLASIKAALESDDGDEQIEALVTLGLTPDISRADKVAAITPMFSDSDRLVRQFACEVAGIVGESDLAETLADLWRNDCISDVRDSASKALERMGGDVAAEYLSKIRQLEENIKTALL